MNPKFNKIADSARRQRNVPAVSAVFGDGSLLETVLRSGGKETAFILWKEEKHEYRDSLMTDSGERLVPYSANNNLIKNDVVLLPSEPEEYGTEEELVPEIQAFIHRYVDISPLFEKIACYYALLSWVYDAFNELPYLRFRGDPGSGKTRALLMIGSLCHKPIFASGASTVSPLFRILDSFRGTLIIDEGDFRLSDERAEIVKILNNGNAKGFPVLRSEPADRKGEFNPRAYHVYGPKLVATRGFFEDRALESRCLTEQMGQARLREDIPINLQSSYKEEARHLRNKLLLFRFRNFHRRKPVEQLIDRAIEPRLNQIFTPLLTIVADPQAREELRELARTYNRELVAERGLDVEAQILEIIRDMLASPFDQRLAIKDITNWFIDRHGSDYERKITTKWIGGIVRKRLGLQTHKSDGNFVVAATDAAKLQRLYEKYGIGSGDAQPPDRDIGTSGTSVGALEGKTAPDNQA